MDTKHLTPLEAWADFWQGYTPPNRMPNDLAVAQLTLKGKLKQPSGHIKTLGAKRIKSLLEKYAPGKYTFHEGQPYFTKE